MAWRDSSWGYRTQNHRSGINLGLHGPVKTYRICNIMVAGNKENRCSFPKMIGKLGWAVGQKITRIPTFPAATAFSLPVLPVFRRRGLHACCLLLLENKTVLTALEK